MKISYLFVVFVGLSSSIEILVDRKASGERDSESVMGQMFSTQQFKGDNNTILGGARTHLALEFFAPFENRGKARGVKKQLDANFPPLLQEFLMSKGSRFNKWLFSYYH